MMLMYREMCAHGRGVVGIDVWCTLRVGVHYIVTARLLSVRI